MLHQLHPCSIWHMTTEACPCCCCHSGPDMPVSVAAALTADQSRFALVHGTAAAIQCRVLALPVPGAADWGMLYTVAAQQRALQSAHALMRDWPASIQDITYDMPQPLPLLLMRIHTSHHSRLKVSS